MIEALVSADVNLSLGSKLPQRGPHDGPLDHLGPHHHHLQPLVPREHAAELVHVCGSGSQGLIVSGPDEMYGQRTGIRVQTSHLNPEAQRQRAREELTAHSPHGLTKLRLLRPRPAGIGPEVGHVLSGQDGLQTGRQVSLHGDPVIPTPDVFSRPRPRLRWERKISYWSTGWLTERYLATSYISKHIHWWPKWFEH